MEGRELLRPCLSTGGLCCFMLLQLDQSPSHTLWVDPAARLSVCLSVCLSGFTFVGNCLCFLSFFVPSKHYSLSLHFDISVSVLHSFPLLSFSSSHSSSFSLPLVSPWFPPLSTRPPSFSLLLPGLCCAVAAHRSGQDRWSQMISGLYSFQQETAWYCCWHDSLRVSAGPTISWFHLVC